MLGLTLVLGIGLFFFAPLLLAKAIAGGQSSVVQRVVEGVIQVTIFLGYLLADRTHVGRAARRSSTTARST